MPQPCEQADTIEDIWEAVDEIKKGQKEGLSELKTEIKELVSEFREVTREMRDILVDGRELKTRLVTDEKNIDILFNQMREMRGDMTTCQGNIEKQLRSIQDWITKEEGGRAIFRYGIPIICTIVSTIAAVAILFHDAGVKP